MTDERDRFRVYRLRGGELQLLATTPNPEGVGVTVVTLFGDGEFSEDDAVGVLDAQRRIDGVSPTGRWVVNPYTTGGAR